MKWRRHRSGSASAVAPASPEAVAETHWRLHTARDLHEVVLGDLATVKAAISAL
ncbi:hypothetical protein [Nonomuraea sp. JJY05]|uniref:hypothetical protein n=1 Tax=Nonomuraea sp. JJY05 TaxID=3350255 RepID=UPI00373ED1B0